VLQPLIQATAEYTRQLALAQAESKTEPGKPTGWVSLAYEGVLACHGGKMGLFGNINFLLFGSKHFSKQAFERASKSFDARCAALTILVVEAGNTILLPGT
jgi:hypothetical protein